MGDFLHARNLHAAEDRSQPYCLLTLHATSNLDLSHANVITTDSLMSKSARAHTADHVIGRTVFFYFRFCYTAEAFPTVAVEVEAVDSYLVLNIEGRVFLVNLL